MHIGFGASRFLVMATSKRERQRQHRAAARRQASSVATRGRIRSRGLKLVLLSAVIVVAVLILWLVLRDGSDDSASNDAASGPQATDATQQSADGSEVLDFPPLPQPPSPGGSLGGEQVSCPDFEESDLRVTTFSAPFENCLNSDLSYTAVFSTTAGEISVALDTESNLEVANAFVVLAGYDYYDGTAIFNTDPVGGYIQGGSPQTNSVVDPGPGFSLSVDDTQDDETQDTEPQDIGLGQLLWSASGDTTGQFVITSSEQVGLIEGISDLIGLGTVDDVGSGVVAEVLSRHVDNPDTAFGGRPAPAVIVESVQIIAKDPALEGSIDLSNCPPADGSGPQVLDFDGLQPMCLDTSKQYTAVFDTTAGEIRVALDTANTPNTANNFAVLARYHYYDDTLLFRTDPSIGIIQGGAPHTNSPSDPGPGYTIPDEGSGFTYEPGQIVMARTNAPNSASAQFFFAVNENTALLNSQGTYVVFGQMDEPSLAVAQAILGSHVDQPNNPLGGGPEPQVIVNSVTIQESN